MRDGPSPPIVLECREPRISAHPQGWTHAGQGNRYWLSTAKERGIECQQSSCCGTPADGPKVRMIWSTQPATTTLELVNPRELGHHQPGDRVYMLRVGKNRGVIARGRVTSLPFIAEAWDGSDVGATFVTLSWEPWRIGGDYLEREALKAKTGWHWHLQSSGCRVPVEVVPRVDAFWEALPTAVERDHPLCAGYRLVAPDGSLIDCLEPLPDTGLEVEWFLYHLRRRPEDASSLTLDLPSTCQ